MTRGRFLSLCKLCQIFKPDAIDSVYLRFVFDSQAATPGNAPGLSLVAFCTTMASVAEQLYPDLGQSGALNKVGFPCACALWTL